VDALKIIFAVLAFISFQTNAQDDRNLVVNRTNEAASEQRIALVIGNSAYINSPLKNPVNDAKDVAKKLRALGFDVIERNNLQTKQIGGTLREFRSKLTPGAVALVFYAGHGLQIKGVNYLPAIDADIHTEEDVPNQSIAMNQIMDVLDESKTRLNLVFLDACRNNPYARSFRSADQGLARVNAPSGTLISYATRPGSVAADGDGRNGLYTSKLIAQMDSNLQIELTLKQVVTAVKTASQGKQEPWMEGSIEGEFCFAGCAADMQVARPVTVPARVKTTDEIEDEYWEEIKDSGDLTSYEHYSKAYPNGRYLNTANLKITQLMKKAQGAALSTPLSALTLAPMRVKSKEEIEQETWESVRDSANFEVIQEYLKQYPKGQYAGSARVLIATLKTVSVKPADVPRDRNGNEAALWDEVKNGSSKDDYDVYLAQYPKGKYAALAKSRIKLFLDKAAIEASGKEQEARQIAEQTEKVKSLSGQWITSDGHPVQIDVDGGKLSIQLSQINFPGSADAWMYDEAVARPNFFEIIENATVSLGSRGSKLAGIIEIPGWAPLSGGYCAVPGEKNQVEGTLDKGRIILKIKKTKFKLVMNRNDGLFDSPKVHCDEVTPTGEMTLEMILTRPLDKGEGLIAGPSEAQ